MLIGSATQRPVILAFAVLDRHVIDARDAPAHEATLVELPVLVAVGTEPLTRVVMPLVSETHRNAIALARPEFLDQAIVQLPVPLARQELHDLRAPRNEFSAVAPHTVGGVRECHAL